MNVMKMLWQQKKSIKTMKSTNWFQTNKLDESDDPEYLLSKVVPKVIVKKVQKRNRELGTGKCSDCDTDITDRATKCSKCFKPDKKFVISKDELHDLVWVQKLPYTKIGQQYGVSDNAIRKRSRVLGVELRKVKNVKTI